MWTSGAVLLRCKQGEGDALHVTYSVFADGRRCDGAPRAPDGLVTTSDTSLISNGRGRNPVINKVDS